MNTYGHREGGRKLLKELTPQVGLEPTTLRLTAECSAIELLRIATPARLKSLAGKIFIAQRWRGCQSVETCAAGASWVIISQLNLSPFFSRRARGQRRRVL